MSVDVSRILEEYGKWEAEALTTYGLDSREATRSSKEIADRLKRMRFRIPAILEKNIYLMDSPDRIYVARIRWRCIILEVAEEETLKEYYFGGNRDKRRILNPLFPIFQKEYKRHHVKDLL